MCFGLNDASSNAIISFEGHLNHWTVVRAVTEQLLTFFDSTKLQRACLANCRMKTEAPLASDVGSTFWRDDRYSCYPSTSAEAISKTSVSRRNQLPSGLTSSTWLTPSAVANVTKVSTVGLR